MNVTDGSVSWEVRDKRKQALIDLIVPVGSVRAFNNSTDPNTVYEGTTWTKIANGRVLQGANDGETVGDLKEAGLPNITGNVLQQRNFVLPTGTPSGAFYEVEPIGDSSGTGGNANTIRRYAFDASRSNPIYGRSNTVQSPAYLVNFWVRTA